MGSSFSTEEGLVSLGKQFGGRHVRDRHERTHGGDRRPAVPRIYIIFLIQIHKNQLVAGRFGHGGILFGPRRSTQKGQIEAGIGTAGTPQVWLQFLL